jgi:hypothetical protein
VSDIAKDHGRHQEQPIGGPISLRYNGCGHIQRHCCFQQHSCQNIMHSGTTVTYLPQEPVQALCQGWPSGGRRNHHTPEQIISLLREIEMAVAQGRTTGQSYRDRKYKSKAAELFVQMSCALK